MPGAVWRPIPISPDRPRRRKGRGVCLHVAVSEAPSLFGFFSTSTSDSHFYVNKAGVIEQYVDTDLVAYANADGNASLISVETQGGVTSPDTEPWTDAQLDGLAAICRWARDVEGVPLQVMPDSRPTSRGIGWHRLGVRPYVVSGGEVWSSSYGKTCPGTRKISQVPEVVRRASPAPPPDPTPPPEDDDMRLNAYRVTGTSAVFAGGPGIWEWVPNNEVLRAWQSSGTLGPIVDVASQASLDGIRNLWLSARLPAQLAADAVTPGAEGRKAPGATFQQTLSANIKLDELLARMPEPPTA